MEEIINFVKSLKTTDTEDIMPFVKKASYVAVFAVGVYGLKWYMQGGVCKSKAKADGKVVIVTGANTGIGKETAKDLALRGAKVYFACRSLDRAEQAVKEIAKETGISRDQLPIMRLDLASLKSIREFAAEFKKKEGKLDILINNAGLMWIPQSKTEDGFEVTFGVNHLGPFLLTHLLMDALASVPKSRIVNVSSLAHGQVRMNFDDLMFEKKFSYSSVYAQSKLANVLFTRELAKRLKGTGISTYSLHPGMVHTDIGREAPYVNNFFIKNILLAFSWPIIKGPKAGAQTSIYCAIDESLEGESGKYYSDCKEKKPARKAQNDESAKKLWDISLELVKLQPSEIYPNLRD